MYKTQLCLPQVVKVNYPGLTSHPAHDVAKKQMKLFGRMISFEMKSLDSAKNLVEVINIGVSLMISPNINLGCKQHNHSS